MEETKALQQLPEMQNIAEYLQGMTFRKKFLGGVDKESVLEHFSAVSQQYEAVISNFMRQAEQNARRLAEVQAHMQGQGGQFAAQPHQPGPAMQHALSPQPGPAPQTSQPPQWYGVAAAYQQQPQQMQQPEPPYAPQTPWPQVNEPWAQQGPPQPIAPQPYALQPNAPQPCAPQPYAPQPAGYPQGFPQGQMYT